MADLSGQTIASSYEQLLSLPDGGGNANTLVAVTDGDGGTTFGIKLATNKVEIIPGSNDANAFEVSQADGTAVLTVDSTNARVGIGGAPLKPLHILDDDPVIRISDANSSSLATATPHIEFYDRSDTNQLGLVGYLSTGDGILSINNKNNASMNFSTNNVERLEIDNAGTFVINGDGSDQTTKWHTGSAYVNAKLDVRQLAIAFSGTDKVTSDTSGNFTFLGNITINGSSSRSIEFYDGSEREGAIVFDEATDGFIFKVGGTGGSLHDAVKILNTGQTTFKCGTDYDQIRLVDTNTNQTTQRTSVNSQHYLSAEEDVRLIGLFSNGSGASATDNIVGIGGGSGSHNAATSIQFYTAANATTVSGNTRLTIKSNGSLVANPGGSGNTAFGEDAGIALNSNTDHNTLFGYQTGKDLVNGDKNVFVGFGAGFAATNTINSVAIGSGALDAVTTGGHYNIAIGTNVLTAVTTGEENVAIGDSVGLNMTATSDCVLIGSGAGVNINHTDADGTVAIGQQALNSLTEGNKNLAVGYQALHDVAGGDGNMGIGYQAGASLGRTEFDNIAIGTRAMLSMQENASSSSVDSNIAIGVDAMTGGELGSSANFLRNIAIGNNALNSTGSHGNTGLMAIGYDALTSNTSGAGNTAIGYLAGQNVATGSENVFLGYNAGQANVGSRSTFVGYQAGVSCNATGNTNNTLIGRTAGQSITSGTGNTIVGSNADASNTTNSNVFGSSVVGTAGTFTFGEGTNDTRATNGGTTWSAPSDRRIKRNIEDSTLGLSFINDLKPRTYNWALKGDLPDFHSDYVKDSTEQWRSDKKVHGFIAQEVKESIDKVGDSVADGFEGWQINEHNDLQRVAEAEFIPALVKAVQELSAKVTELESKLGE